MVQRRRFERRSQGSKPCVLPLDERRLEKSAKHETHISKKNWRCRTESNCRLVGCNHVPYHWTTASITAFNGPNQPIESASSAFGTGARSRTEKHLFLRQVGMPIPFRRPKVGGCDTHPPGTESGLDVYQSVQQSVETTHDREIADVLGDFLEGL